MGKINTCFLMGFAAVLAIALESCHRGKSQPVARSYDAYLYPEGLQGVVPPGVTGNDSIQLAHAYIEQWIRQQALLHHAQRNVNINSERLERQVTEYRNGLIVYEYEQALVSQKLDTVVTDGEIQAYYKAREALFTLKQPIFKMTYVKLKPDAPELDRVKRWFLSADFEDRDLLEKYCAVYALDYQLQDTGWHYASELANRVPFARINEGDYGKTGRIFEIIENNELYLIILHDSRFGDDRSPLALEYENIRNLILNKRKIELIDQMHKLIMDDARKKNNIETYN
ncbi:peptidylprolyl isomerase [Parapedobacter lycopersici]|uniref:peptidylprolyl isomerase n=1 Tax=Parapedobacter lycopersici TaxID=1864939 RepID=UPI00334055D8